MTKLLITGCARSGTKYLVELLKAAGINATHEKALLVGRNPGQHDWSKAGDVDVNSDMGLEIEEAAKYVQAIGHVVREPQKVVASILGRGMLDAGWGIRHRAYYQSMDWYDAPIDRVLAYWVAHNKRCSDAAIKHRGYYFEITGVPQALEGLLIQAGIDYDWFAVKAAYVATPRNINHYPNTPPITYSWEDHDPELRSEAEAMCERYGLKVPSHAIA